MKKVNIILVIISMFYVDTSFAQVQLIQSGELGVGTTTPTEQLDINGNVRVRGNEIKSDGAMRLRPGQSTLSSADNRVGINLSSNPTTTLDVNGSLKVRNGVFFTQNRNIDLRPGSSTHGVLIRQKGDVTDWGNMRVVDNGFEFSFKSNTAPQFKIDPNGATVNGHFTVGDLNLGIGNIFSDGYVSLNPSNGNFIYLKSDNAYTGVSILDPTEAYKGYLTAKDYGFDIGVDPVGTKITIENTNGFVGINTTTPTLELDVNGAVGATTFTSPSDENLKKDVQKFEKGLEQVLQLEPIRFKYNGKAEINSNREHIGLFAQNLEEIAPEMVERFQGYEKDQNGRRVEGEKYLRIHDSEIKYLLINAIKDQQNHINGLKDEIVELKTLVNKLLVSSGTRNNLNVQLEKFEKASIQQNSPNPFGSVTFIDYNLPEGTGVAKLYVSDSMGRSLQTFNISQKGSGRINLDASKYMNGTYSYSLVVDGKLIDTKKMIISK